MREEKKAKNRQLILSYAKQLFLEKGYNLTTIKDIAKLTGLAVGTIYNYYSSKSKLFIEILQADMQESFQFKDISHEGVSINELIYQYMKHQTSMIMHYPKSLWREVLAILASPADEGLGQQIFAIDRQIMTEIQALLAKFNHTKDPELLSQIIYSVYMTDFILFIYQDELTAESMLAILKKKLNILL